MQAGLFRLVSGYHDTMFAAQTFETGWEDQIRDVYALHILNHVQKQRDLVARHNSRIKAEQAKEREAKKQRRMQR